VFTLNVVNTSASTAAINLRADFRVSRIKWFGRALFRLNESTIHVFEFADLAPGKQGTLIFPERDSDAGLFEYHVSRLFSDLLTPLTPGGTGTKMPFYRVNHIGTSRWKYGLLLSVRVSYDPAVAGAKKQKVFEAYALKPVLRPGDVGGTTDVLHRWEIAPQDTRELV
jgi:hypothetical protein